jgi:hypothetical protein
MIRRIFTACCSACLIFGAVHATPLKAEQPVHVVLLGGQSNMEGAGNYNALSDKDQLRAEAIADRVLISRNGGDPEPLSFHLSEYQKDKRGFAECFGPELFIGITLAEQNPNQHYLLIKRAQGGTALYGAWNPEWTAEKADAVETKAFKKTLKLYSLHLAAIQENLAKLNDYKIIGMAWMQGENDAAKEVSARSYEANLKKLVAGYRAEFMVPEMPFVCGQINSHYGNFSEGPEMVRQAFVAVAASDPNVATIKTKADAPWTDFPKHDDQVHYNHEGQKRLGTAMGKALLKLSN